MRKSRVMWRSSLRAIAARRRMEKGDIAMALASLKFHLVSDQVTLRCQGSLIFGPAPLPFSGIERRRWPPCSSE